VPNLEHSFLRHIRNQAGSGIRPGILSFLSLSLHACVYRFCYVPETPCFLCRRLHRMCHLPTLSFLSSLIQITLHYVVFVVLRPDMGIIDRVAASLGDQPLDVSSHTTIPHSTMLPPSLEHSSNLTTNSPPFHDRENATFVFLCRNNDINGVVSSMQQLEDRFNRRYHYPWVFLNEEPFTEEFKECPSLKHYLPCSFLIPSLSGG